MLETRIPGGMREVHAMTRFYMSLTITGSESDSEAEAQMDLDVYRVRCARDESDLVRDHAENGGGSCESISYAVLQEE